MGKFYVVINVDTHTYKLCRDDVHLVHSKRKIIAPPLPRYKDKHSQQATSD